MKICVGKILRPHGVRGDVLLKFYTTSGDFFTQNQIFYTPDNHPIKLFNVRTSKEHLIANVKGARDRNAVEHLKNTELFVPRESMPQTADGEYYFEDLKQMQVTRMDGQIIGKVVNVEDYGAGTFLEIKLEPNKEATIPFNKFSIVNVDVEQSLITIDENFLLTT